MIQEKKFLSAAFSFYLLMLIYFMFFAFGRAQLSEAVGYRYNLIPTCIPLWLPRNFSIDTLKLWIFSLGNLLAFVPFGIFMPVLFRKYCNKYYKLMGLFLIFILSLEILQMLTHLGSFDIEDVIVNTIGVTIGFYSYKISGQVYGLPRKMAACGLAIMTLSLMAFVIARIVNNTIIPSL